MKMQDKTLFPTDKPDFISFEYGAPGPDLLPVKLVQEAVTHRLSQSDAFCSLQYGPMLGDTRFRKQVVVLT